MKRLIALLLAVLAVAALACGCAKKEKEKSENEYMIEAILDYYVNRKGLDITEKDIKYVGENEDGRKTEFFVDNSKEDVSETVLVAGLDKVFMLYDETGMRLHIYNGAEPETTK